MLKEQESDGSWYGRWGLNYVYGTWTALCSLNAAGMPHDDPRMKRGAQWLVSIQNEDGGWGEGGESYKLDYRGYERAPSTASQTAWALMGLMAAGECRIIGRSRVASSICSVSSASMVCGTKRASPRPVSRACSICVTTAIASSSRSGRWRVSVI